MRILFIVYRFGRDGLSTNVRDLTKGLRERDHEIHIITSGFRKGTSQDLTFFNELIEEFNQLGVKMHFFKQPTGNSLNKGSTALFGLVNTLSWIIQIDPDIIHCHSPNTTFLPWLLRRKFISTVHADTLRPNFKYKHPHLLIAVSTGSKEFTEKVMGTDPKSVRIVHHGISDRFLERQDSIQLQELKEVNEIPKDKLIIGFVGRITPMKGTDVLLNAIGKFLSKDIVDKIHLVFVGDYQTTNDKEWLEQLLSENNLNNKLTLLSFRDPKPYYELFDVFVLPSRSDTFGLVSVEAMMSGCCTIRSDSYGAKDQIEHGKSGFIFEMESSEELGRLLELVLTNDVLRRDIANAGLEKAKSQFTIDKMVDNTLAVYQELLQS
jgi:glycosyltransferase involved in cell wall biosynthesis